MEETPLTDMPEVDTNSLNTCQIELGPKVGEGQFAKVYIGRLMGEHVAVKKQRSPVDGSDETMAKYLALELKVLQFCDHPHILKYIGCCVENDECEDDEKPMCATWIVTEYVACGDLLRLLEDRTASVEWYLRLRMARELAEALAYLHSRNIMHRDVKSSNVLLDGSWHVKLGDFGMATEAPNGRCTTICGTDEYMAPELHLGETESYGLAADVFSLGMVYVEIGARLKAKEAAPRSPRTKFALDTDDMRSKMKGPASFVELAMQCVAYEDYDRIAAEDAMAWLEELELESSDQALTPSSDNNSDLPAPLPVPSFGGSSGYDGSSFKNGGVIAPEGVVLEEPRRWTHGDAPVNVDIDDVDDDSGSNRHNGSGFKSDASTEFSDDTKSAFAGGPAIRQQPPAMQGVSESRTAPQPRRNLLVLGTDRPDAARASGRGLSLMAAKRIHSLREVGIETTRMAGFLHKKARTSFASRYQRRWFVLKRGTLLWFNAPGNANALGRVALSATAELVSTAPTKFAVFARPLQEEVTRTNFIAGPVRRQSSGGAGSGSSRDAAKRKPLLELMAPDETAKDMWLQALQTEIDERVVDDVKLAGVPETTQAVAARRASLGDVVAVPRYPASSSPHRDDPNRRPADVRFAVPASPGDGSTSTGSPVPAPAPDKKGARAAYFNSSNNNNGAAQPAPVVNDKDHTVTTWIDMMRLPSSTSAKFTAAGYTDLRMILEMGLTDEDLDFIGISVPLHRRLLMTAVAEKSFTTNLESKVVDYRICGTVALYTITSRYKFRRSTLHLRYANFVTLYAKLRSIAYGSGATSRGEPLPKLPGSRVFVDHKGPMFLEQRRLELHQYLEQTIAMAHNDHRLEDVLVQFLELNDAGDGFLGANPSNSPAPSPSPPPPPRTAGTPTRRGPSALPLD